MDLWLEEGDYVPDGKGGFVEASGVDGLVQRLLYRLTVPLGSFAPLPEFGSELPYLSRQKPSSWTALAGQYVRLALEEEEDASLDYVTVTALGEGQIEIEINLIWQGETVSFSTVVG